MNSKCRNYRLRFSLRSLLLACCAIAILIAYREAIVNCYHRLQIQALTNGYYDAPWQEIVATVEYHYSELANSGAIARVSHEFSGATPPDLATIMRLPNLPPHLRVSLERGAKTAVNVYTETAEEQNWKYILESLDP